MIFVIEISNFGAVDENLLSFRYLTRNGTELSLKEKMFAHKKVPLKNTPKRESDRKYFVFLCFLTNYIYIMQQNRVRNAHLSLG